MLIAQVVAGYSLVQVILAVIIIAAACAILAVILRACGVTLPQDVKSIGLIVVVVALGIVAILFLARLAGLG
jgi:hypothetical protein